MMARTLLQSIGNRDKIIIMLANYQQLICLVVCGRKEDCIVEWTTWIWMSDILWLSFVPSCFCSVEHKILCSNLYTVQLGLFLCCFRLWSGQTSLEISYFLSLITCCFDCRTLLNNKTISWTKNVQLFWLFLVRTWLAPVCLCQFHNLDIVDFEWTGAVYFRVSQMNVFMFD